MRSSSATETTVSTGGAEQRSSSSLALGGAFRRQPRDLTPKGLTQPDYERDEADVGPGRIVALIPAHDEAALIKEALESLAAQTRVAEVVIVITDRCADLTGKIELARDVAVVAQGFGGLDVPADAQLGYPHAPRDSYVQRRTDTSPAMSHVTTVQREGSIPPQEVAARPHPGTDHKRTVTT